MSDNVFLTSYPGLVFTNYFPPHHTEKFDSSFSQMRWRNSRRAGRPGDPITATYWEQLKTTLPPGQSRPPDQFPSNPTAPLAAPNISVTDGDLLP
ncbi:MAG: hypothetical protein JWO38_55 [Gemmataceae bacterium]|nr:hypothetical protein [Gemmataceae bacterium]